MRLSQGKTHTRQGPAIRGLIELSAISPPYLLTPLAHCRRHARLQDNRYIPVGRIMSMGPSPLDPDGGGITNWSSPEGIPTVFGSRVFGSLNEFNPTYQPPNRACGLSMGELGSEWIFPQRDLKRAKCTIPHLKLNGAPILSPTGPGGVVTNLDSQLILL